MATLDRLHEQLHGPHCYMCRCCAFCWAVLMMLSLASIQHLRKGSIFFSRDGFQDPFVDLSQQPNLPKPLLTGEAEGRMPRPSSSPLRGNRAAQLHRRAIQTQWVPRREQGNSKGTSWSTGGTGDPAGPAGTRGKENGEERCAGQSGEGRTKAFGNYGAARVIACLRGCLLPQAHRISIAALHIMFSSSVTFFWDPSRFFWWSLEFFLAAFGAASRFSAFLVRRRWCCGKSSLAMAFWTLLECWIWRGRNCSVYFCFEFFLLFFCVFLVFWWWKDLLGLMCIVFRFSSGLELVDWLEILMEEAPGVGQESVMFLPVWEALYCPFSVVFHVVLSLWYREFLEWTSPFLSSFPLFKAWISSFCPGEFSPVKLKLYSFFLAIITCFRRFSRLADNVEVWAPCCYVVEMPINTSLSECDHMIDLLYQ